LGSGQADLAKQKQKKKKKKREQKKVKTGLLGEILGQLTTCIFLVSIKYS
jgi:hypothetical protein